MTEPAAAPAPAPASKRSHHKKASKAAPSPVDGVLAAHGLMEMVELFTVARFGPDAAFSPEERFFIEPSLARLIERYGSVVQEIGWLVDPVMLAAGVGLYAIRLSSLVAKPRQEVSPDESTPQAPNDETGPGEAIAQVDPRADTPTVTPDLAQLFGSALKEV